MQVANQIRSPITEAGQAVNKRILKTVFNLNNILRLLQIEFEVQFGRDFLNRIGHVKHFEYFKKVRKMTRLALIFLYKDSVMLGEFDDDGIIDLFKSIDDEDEIYADLNPEDFAVVQVSDLDHQIQIQDLGRISLCKFEDPVPVKSFLEELGALPEDEFEETWMGFYSQLLSNTNSIKLH